MSTWIAENMGLLIGVIVATVVALLLLRRTPSQSDEVSAAQGQGGPQARVRSELPAQSEDPTLTTVAERRPASDGAPGGQQSHPSASPTAASATAGGGDIALDKLDLSSLDFDLTVSDDDQSIPAVEADPNQLNVPELDFDLSGATDNTSSGVDFDLSGDDSDTQPDPADRLAD